MDFFRYSIGTLAKAEFLATKMFYGYRRIMGKDGLLGWDEGANEDWQIIEYTPGYGNIKLGGWFVFRPGVEKGGPHSKE